MKPLSLPEFDELTTALNSTELKLHASQVHGLISGFLCGNINQEAEWEELLLGEKLEEDARTIMQSLFKVSENQLKEFLFEFQMALPDDTLPLPERAEALGVWCQGFLAALKATGVAIENREPSELTEAIDDLIEIAKMNYSDVAECEEDETAYVELVEYVRVAVIFIYQDLRESELPAEDMQADQLH
jgi:uncharacterized protein YgfB (UPF0149 family)